MSEEKKRKKMERPEDPDKPLGALVISVSPAEDDAEERRQERMAAMAPEDRQEAEAGARIGELDPQDQAAAQAGREAGAEMEEFLAGLDEGQRAILLRKLQEGGD